MTHNTQRLIIPIALFNDGWSPVGDRAYDSVVEARRDVRRLVDQFNSDEDGNLSLADIEFKPLAEYLREMTDIVDPDES